MSDQSRGLFHSLASTGDAVLTPIAQLLTRLVFGQSFFLIGLGKLNDLAKTTESFENLGIPFAKAQAPMIAALECVGGILLLLGLGTRIFALLLGCTMVVATLTAHRAEVMHAFTFDTSFASISPLPFLVGLVWLVAKGPGRISADYVIVRRQRN